MSSLNSRINRCETQGLLHGNMRRIFMIEGTGKPSDFINAAVVETSEATDQEIERRHLRPLDPYTKVVINAIAYVQAMSRMEQPIEITSLQDPIEEGAGGQG